MHENVTISEIKENFIYKPWKDTQPELALKIESNYISRINSI